MRILIFIVIGLLGLPFIPSLIRSALPGLPTSFEEVPTPFYWVQESDRGNPVLVQYYAPPLKHQIVLGDTNFLLPETWQENAYEGPVEKVKALVEESARIVSLDLEGEGSGLFRLAVEFDDIGASGATFWYRENEGKIEPVWSSYAGMSLIPHFGGKAWLTLGGIWLGLMVVMGVVVGRKRPAKAPRSRSIPLS